MLASPAPAEPVMKPLDDANEMKPGIAFTATVLCRAKRSKIEETLIHEKRWGDVGDRRRDAVRAAGGSCLPLTEQRLHFLPL